MNAAARRSHLFLLRLRHVIDSPFHVPGISFSPIHADTGSCRFDSHFQHARLLCLQPAESKLDESEMKDHVMKLHDYLVNFAIPKFFAIRHPWAIYSKDVYFENRLWDEVEVTKGLDAYAWKLMRFRFGAMFSYARSKLEVMASQIEDREITIHWRFSGLPQSVVFFAFWRFRPWKMKEAKQENSRIIEGISTLSIGSDQLIYKHVIDRLVLDKSLEKSPSKHALLEKLAKLRNLETEKVYIKKS